MSFLWLVLIGTDGYSAEALANASASVISPANASDAIVDIQEAASARNASAGNMTVRVAGAGLPVDASVGDAESAGYSVFISDAAFSRLALAGFDKLAAGDGMLIGAPVAALSVGVADKSGFVTITVIYN